MHLLEQEKGTKHMRILPMTMANTRPQNTQQNKSVAFGEKSGGGYIEDLCQIMDSKIRTSIVPLEQTIKKQAGEITAQNTTISELMKMVKNLTEQVQRLTQNSAEKAKTPVSSHGGEIIH